MQPPRTLKPAKAALTAEQSTIGASLSAIIGSRWLLAILATFAIAFGTHLAYAPNRLPPVAGLSAAQLGLPEAVDFGLLGEQAAKAGQAAERQGAASRVQAFIEENRERAPLINMIGFALTLVLLGVNMTVMTMRRRRTRG